MRKLKYYVACSVDGFIAHEDDSWGGFLFEGEPVQDYLKSLNHFDIVFMGRRTYEMGLKEGKTNPYPTMKSYVFSRTMEKSPDPKVEIVRDNINELVKTLQQEDGQDIYLCGGAKLATSLFAEKLIDELVLKINPFIMGAGIPLFSDVVKQTPLKLIKSMTYDNGFVLLHYQINHGTN